MHWCQPGQGCCTCAMASAEVGVAPIAKQSDRACTAAMRPKRKLSLTTAFRTSTVWSTNWPGGACGSSAASSRSPTNSAAAPAGQPECLAAPPRHVPGPVPALIDTTSAGGGGGNGGREARTVERARGPTLAAQPRHGIAAAAQAAAAAGSELSNTFGAAPATGQMEVQANLAF